MPLLTAVTIGNVRGLRAQTLTHTYTWIQRTGTVVDSEGGTVPAWGLPVAGRPCHLLPQEVTRVDPSGAPLEMQAPRLIVAWDDPIMDGDAVRDVYDADGNLLLSGPAAVMSLTVQVAADVPTHQVAVLSFETAQRQPAVPT
jgi:hypothetical protein